MWRALYCNMRTQSFNLRKRDTSSQIGLIYTNEPPVLSLIACALSDCVLSRSLLAFKVEIISLCSWIKLFQKLSIIQNTVDPRLTDVNATGNFIGCKWNAPESLSIKDGTLIYLQCKFMLEMFQNGIFVWFVHINILVCLSASLHCTDITGQSHPFI